MKRNTPNRDLDELTVEELICVVQHVAGDLLADGYTTDELLQHKSYRDLERYVDDRLHALRNRETRSQNDRSESRVVVPILRFLKESYLQDHAKTTRLRD